MRKEERTSRASENRIYLGWLASPPLIRTVFCLPLPFFLAAAAAAADEPLANPFSPPTPPLPFQIPPSASLSSMTVLAAGLASAARIRARRSASVVESCSEGKSRPFAPRGAAAARDDPPKAEAEPGREIDTGVPLPERVAGAVADEDDAAPREGNAGPTRIGPAPAADEVEAVGPPPAALDQAVLLAPVLFFCIPALLKPGICLALLALIKAGKGFDRGATGAGPLDRAACSTRAQVDDGLCVLRC